MSVEVATTVRDGIVKAGIERCGIVNAGTVTRLMSTTPELSVMPDMEALVP